MANFGLTNQENEEFESEYTSQTTESTTDLTEEATMGTQNDLGSFNAETVSTNTTTTQSTINRKRRTPPTTSTRGRIKCPSCGSTEIKYVTRTEEKEKNWGLICLVLFVFWPVGLIMALKKEKKTYQKRKCTVCDREF